MNRLLLKFSVLSKSRILTSIASLSQYEVHDEIRELYSSWIWCKADSFGESSINSFNWTNKLSIDFESLTMSLLCLFYSLLSTLLKSWLQIFWRLVIMLDNSFWRNEVFFEDYSPFLTWRNYLFNISTDWWDGMFKWLLILCFILIRIDITLNDTMLCR